MSYKYLLVLCFAFSPSWFLLLHLFFLLTTQFRPLLFSFLFSVTFRLYDVNNDGFISNGDLFHILKAMVGNNLTEVQLQQLVDRTIIQGDKDKDGKLSYEEFVDVRFLFDFILLLLLFCKPCSVLSVCPLLRCVSPAKNLTSSLPLLPLWMKQMIKNTDVPWKPIDI